MEDSLYFSEQHIAVRNMVREFAQGEVAPVAAKFDAEAKFPWANIKRMGSSASSVSPGRKSSAEQGSISSAI